MIEIGGHFFTGPFKGIVGISESPGVYVILLKKNNCYSYIEIGHSNNVYNELFNHNNTITTIEDNNITYYAVHYRRFQLNEFKKEIISNLDDKTISELQFSKAQL